MQDVHHHLSDHQFLPSIRPLSLSRHQKTLLDNVRLVQDERGEGWTSGDFAELIDGAPPVSSVSRNLRRLQMCLAEGRAGSLRLKTVDVPAGPSSHGGVFVRWTLFSKA